jgi:hypothetical protein
LFRCWSRLLLCRCFLSGRLASKTSELSPALHIDCNIITSKQQPDWYV